MSESEQTTPQIPAPSPEPQPVKPAQPSLAELAAQPVNPATAPSESTNPPSEIKEADVWEALKMVFDPEIPVSIVDLGLVYDVHVEGRKVLVKMTLTMPGCMMGPSIAGDAQMRILALPGVEEASVELVWDPPWHQSMISEEARKRLGLE